MYIHWRKCAGIYVFLSTISISVRLSMNGMYFQVHEYESMIQLIGKYGGVIFIEFNYSITDWVLVNIFLSSRILIYDSVNKKI